MLLAPGGSGGAGLAASKGRVSSVGIFYRSVALSRSAMTAKYRLLHRPRQPQACASARRPKKRQEPGTAKRCRIRCELSAHEAFDLVGGPGDRLMDRLPLLGAARNHLGHR